MYICQLHVYDVIGDVLLRKYFYCSIKYRSINNLNIYLFDGGVFNKTWLFSTHVRKRDEMVQECVQSF